MISGNRSANKNAQGKCAQKVSALVVLGEIFVISRLLDFERDLYGEELKPEFVGRLRDEMKFDGVEALLKQIHADIGKKRDPKGLTCAMDFKSTGNCLLEIYS